MSPGTNTWESTFSTTLSCDLHEQQSSIMASTDTSATINGDLSAAGTGVDLQRLTGQVNYLRFKRDFQIVAMTKGVWDVIEGTEPILPKPNRDDYFKITRRSSRLTATGQSDPSTSKEKAKDEKEGADDTADPLLSIKIQEYRLDLDEYTRNQKNVRHANALIAFWVDSSIRGNLVTCATPKEAWDWLEEQYKMQPERTLHISLNQIERLHLEKCTSVQHFINELEGLRLDIEQSGGTYSNEQMIAKILRSLTSDYDDFLNQYYFLQDVPGVSTFKLKDVTARLLTHESKLQEKAKKGKQVNAARKEADKGGNTQSQSGDKQRPKCTYKKCKRWGHTEDNCWIKHPELKKERDKKKAEEDSKSSSPSSSSSSSSSSSDSPTVVSTTTSSTDDKKQSSDKTVKKIATMCSVPSLQDFLAKAAEAPTIRPLELKDAFVQAEIDAAGDGDILMQDGQMAVVHGTKGCPKVRLDILLRVLFGPDDMTPQSATASFPNGNRFAPLDTPLGKKYTAAGMTHDLQEDDHSHNIKTGTQHYDLSLPLPITDHATQSTEEQQTWTWLEVLGRVFWEIGLCVIIPVFIAFWVKLVGRVKETTTSVMAVWEGEGAEKQQFMIDSGANIHLCNQRSWFSSFKPFGYKVGTAAADQNVNITGVGTVNVPLSSGTQLDLNSVAYSANARANIISLGLLAKIGHLHGTWGPEGITIMDDDGLVATASMNEDALFFLDAETQSNIPSGPIRRQAHVVDFSDPVWNWHRKLGHLPLQSMRKLIRVTTGIPLTDRQIKERLGEMCPICEITKATINIPRDPATRRADGIGNLLHVDVWGPYRIPAWDGTKYILQWTDDAERFSWMLRLENLTDEEVVEGMKQFHVDFETRHDTKIKAYRFDTDLAKRRQFANWARERGTEMEPIVPYQHYMNGVAERQFRTNRDRVAPMMQELSLPQSVQRAITGRMGELMRVTTAPEKFWVEAYQHSLWLRNRSTTRALAHTTTPWERVKGTKPDCTREHVWASRVFVTIPPEKRQGLRGSKLTSNRGWMGYWMGFDENESVYRVWDPEADKVVRVSVGRVDDGNGMDDPHPEGVDPIDREQDAQENADVRSESDESSASQYDGNEIPPEPVGEDSEPVGEDAGPASDDSPQQSENGDGRDLPMNQRSRFFGLSWPTLRSLVASVSHGDDLPRQRARNQTWTPEENEKLVQLRNANLDLSWEEFRINHYPNDTSSNLKKKFSKLTPPRPVLSAEEQKIRDCQTIDLRAQNLTFAKIGEIVGTRGPYVNKRFHELMEDDEWKQGFDRLVSIYGSGTPKTLFKDRCRNCFGQDEGLKKTCQGPGGCTHCKVHNLQCDGLTEMQVLDTISGTDARLKYLAEHDIQDDRCIRCFTHNYTCYPNPDDPEGLCVSCRARATSLGVLKSSFQTCKPIFARAVTDPSSKCFYCLRGIRRCNGGRPCFTCIQSERPCIYINPDGLSSEMFFPESVMTELVEKGYRGDEYGWCYRCNKMMQSGKYSSNRVQCNSGRPCSQCMSDMALDKKEGQNSSYCQYNLPDKVIRFSVKPKNEQSLADTRINRIIACPLIAALPLDADLNLDQVGEIGEAFALDHDRASVQGNEDAGNQDQCGDPDLPLGQIRKFVFEPEPVNLRQALSGPEAEQWQAAANEEYDSLRDMGVFEVADLPAGKKPLTVKWVFKRKLTSSLEIDLYKGRLVARGFQQKEGIDFGETFASVVKAGSYRLLFALASFFGWQCRQSDFKTAFLNADLDEEIYILEPEGFERNPGKVLRLLKGLYGLRQSARLWYQDLRNWLVDHDFTISRYDESVFFRKEGDGTVTILASYVDDIIHFSPHESHLLALEADLSNDFSIRHLGECERYLGIEIARNRQGEVFLHQAPYIDEVVERFGLQDLHRKFTPMTPGAVQKLRKETSKTATNEFRQRYQGLTGSWMYLVQKTRPDIAVTMSKLSSFNSNPNQEHMDALLYVSAYLKSTRTVGIGFSGQGIEMYCDSSHQDCPDTLRSTSGWVTMICGGAASWASRRQTSPSKSSCESEYKAASEAVSEAIWMKNFLDEIGLEEIDTSNGIKINMDSTSAMKLARNPKYHGATKHINASYHFIRHAIEQGDVRLQWIPSKDMIADGLTKPLPRDTFEEFRKRLGMTTLEEHMSK